MALISLVKYRDSIKNKNLFKSPNLRMGMTVFHWADYLVFAASLGVCLVIGLVQGIKDRWGMKSGQGNVDSGQLHPVPTILSTVATALSSSFVLGVPAEVYYVNTEIFMLGVAVAAGACLSMVIFMQKMHDLGMPNIFVVSHVKATDVVSNIHVHEKS